MGIERQAKELADVLASRQIRIVLAESCTAGLAAASLAQIPGISDWLCGSAVTYRDATKQAWLDVSASDLRDYSAVSEPVAVQMALGVLNLTAEADVSGSITGHLGPGAPPELDGVVYVAVARREQDRSVLLEVQRVVLKSKKRPARQVEAAALLLDRVKYWIGKS
ncbi:MAG: nicotinamide-nucleotide amidohydrolase family protein [Pirellulales bacterium]